MNLSPLAIALQGIGYGTFSTAVQGFTAALLDDNAYSFPSRRVRVIRKKRENDEALLLFVL